MTTNPSKKLDGFSWNFKGKVGRAPNFFLNLHHIQCLHTDNQHPSTKTVSKKPLPPTMNFLMDANPLYWKKNLKIDIKRVKILNHWHIFGDGGFDQYYLGKKHANLLFHNVQLTLTSALSSSFSYSVSNTYSEKCCMLLCRIWLSLWLRCSLASTVY